MNDYRNLRYQLNNMDTYHPLTQKVSILKQVSNKYFRGKLIDVGCGEMPYKNLINDSCKIDEYIGVDIENPVYQNEVKPDVFWDGKTIPIVNDTFDSAILIEVLEHVPYPEIVLNEIHRVLKKGGHLVITVPFLWNLHDVPNDEYRYTPYALKRILENCNFEIIEMESFGSWHASLATMLALYSRRALVGKKKYVASLLTKPLIKYLYKKDKNLNKTDFSKSQMITGLWCVVKTI